MTHHSPIDPAKIHDPRATPAAKWVALLFGVALLALAIIAGREIYILGSDTTNQQSWAHPVLEIIGNARYQDWMFPLGIVAAILGLILLYVAIRPRTKTHRRIEADIPIYMRPIDLVRMFTASAERVHGVKDAHTQITGRSIIVTIHGDSSDPDLIDRVTTTLTPLCGLLARTPTLEVERRRDGSHE